MIKIMSNEEYHYGEAELSFFSEIDGTKVKCRPDYYYKKGA